MSTKHRTSFALDEATADRLQLLARRWKVSQAEVVRRAVRLAAERAATEEESVLERLHDYRTRSQLDGAAAEAYLETVRHDRATWGREW